MTRALQLKSTYYSRIRTLVSVRQPLLLMIQRNTLKSWANMSGRQTHVRNPMAAMHLCFAGVVIFGLFAASQIDAVAESPTNPALLVARGKSGSSKSNAPQTPSISMASAEESANSCTQRSQQRGRLFASSSADEEEYQDSCNDQFLQAMEIGNRILP